MTFHITLEDAIKWVSAEVEGNESKIYKEADREFGGWPQCNYIENGEGSCLIGRALLNHTPVTAKQLATADLGGGTDVSALLVDWRVEGVVTFDWEASHFLAHVQEMQDSGQTWGSALEGGLARYGAA